MAEDPTQSSLAEADIEALETVLFDDRWPEGAMDFFGFHGAVCASAIGPIQVPDAALFAVITAQDPASAGEPPAVIRRSVAQLTKNIRQILEQGESLQLPEPEDGDARDALENWCAGFVDTFLLAEDDWVAEHEDDVAQLLVPVMTLSNLFDDEDFRKVNQDEQQAEQMADQIPDTLTDLYLLFHSP